MDAKLLSPTKSSLRVNRAITGATTVSANSYAIVNYTLSPGSSSYTGAWGGVGAPGVVDRTFGPGQAIPSSFSFNAWLTNGQISVVTATLANGVEFTNS